MTVKIVTDSSSDISEEVAGELGIAVVPAIVLFGTESYRDGVDLTPEQFYEKLVQSKALPTTSVPSPATFAEVYDGLAEETGEILVITISRKLSGIYEAALEAVEQMKKKCRVEVMDCPFSLAAEGLIVIAAAKAAKAGASLDELMELTRRNMSRADLRIAFDTLEYLKRGGRIGRAQAFLGSVLKVNPIITLKDGETHPVTRERSRARAIEHLYNFVMGFSRIEEMAIEDGTTPEEAEALAERLSAKFPRERIYRGKISPAVATHVGPQAISIAVLGDRD